MTQNEIKLDAARSVLWMVQEMKRQATRNQYIANENAWGVFTSKEEAQEASQIEMQSFIYWGKLEEVIKEELILLKGDSE